MKKELRALLPLWAGGVTAVATMSLLLPDWPTSARMVFGMVLIALAAMSIGQEYLHGTLPSLLMLPSTRGRLLVMKLAALGPMLLSLGLLGFILLPPDPRFNRGTIAPRLSLFCAVLIAPLLTIVSRSPLAGIVFAVGLIGFSQILGAQWTPVALVVLSAIGIVGGWRAFMRLEAIDSWSDELSLPSWSGGSSNTTWLLIQKELRLQQMSFIVAVVHLVFSWGYTVALERTPESLGVLETVGFIYGALLAVLIGSLASAEERRMHTLEWQLLLPIAAWKQWAIKIAVVLCLALSMCLALPFALAGEVNVGAWPVAIIVVLTVGSLYVSTRCQSGLVALAWSTPVMLILLMAGIARIAPLFMANRNLVAYPLLVAITVFVVLALRLGYENHRLARG